MAFSAANPELGFLRVRGRPATEALVRISDHHAAPPDGGAALGVASICAQLDVLGVAIAPSTSDRARATTIPSRLRWDHTI